MEIRKLWPDVEVTGQACPMWVPLVECNEYDSPGADYFVQKRVEGILRRDPLIDTLVLACTHYPLLMNKILKYTPPGVRLVPQGEYVAQSLRAYLGRHPEMARRLSTRGETRYLTTETAPRFAQNASRFMHEEVEAETIRLG